MTGGCVSGCVCRVCMQSLRTKTTQLGLRSGTNLTQTVVHAAQPVWTRTLTAAGSLGIPGARSLYRPRPAVWAPGRQTPKILHRHSGQQRRPTKALSSTKKTSPALIPGRFSGSTFFRRRKVAQLFDGPKGRPHQVHFAPLEPLLRGTFFPTFDST